MSMKVSVALCTILALTYGVFSQDFFEGTAMMNTEDYPTEMTITDTPSTSESCINSEWSEQCTCDNATGLCGFTRNVTCNGEYSGDDFLEVDRSECTFEAQWTPTNWSECSVPCGVGNQTRYYICDESAASANQTVLPCPDTIPENETQSCDSGIQCPAWTDWDDWSPCSATCDGGFETTQRTCNMTIELQPSESDFSECIGEFMNSSVCGLAECPLSDAEATNGVYVSLGSTMTVENYYTIRRILQTVIILIVDEFCSEADNYAVCCPDKPTWSYNGTKQYVDNGTLLLKGAFKPADDILDFLMLVEPDIDNNILCNGAAAPAGRRRRAADGFYLPASAVTAVASSSDFATAVTAAAAKAGFNITVLPPISVAAANALKAGTTTRSSVVVTATTIAPNNLAAIIGGSVGGGLGVLAIVLITVVVVKKKQAKTGVAEISGNGHDHHQDQNLDHHQDHPEYGYPAQAHVVAAPASQP